MTDLRGEDEVTFKRVEPPSPESPASKLPADHAAQGTRPKVS
ncbi:MAG: hypothetical protein ACXWNU_09405 [Candidatus Binataceae bacterium]